MLQAKAIFILFIVMIICDVSNTKHNAICDEDDVCVSGEESYDEAEKSKGVKRDLETDETEPKNKTSKLKTSRKNFLHESDHLIQPEDESLTELLVNTSSSFANDSTGFFSNSKNVSFFNGTFDVEKNNMSFSKNFSFFNDTSEVEKVNKSETSTVDSILEQSTTTNEEVTETQSTVSSTQTTETSTTNSTPTTLPPPTTTTAKSLFAFETSQTSDSCLCDLLVEECDVNCCCDEDCSFSQKRVFTHCKDSYVSYDPNYCYKTNFIYKNNTKYKMAEHENRLFCIVKDNLPSRLSYKSKEIIKSLEEFEKRIRRKRFYMFHYGRFTLPVMNSVPYRAGHLVWSLQKGSLTPFKFSTSSVGSRCTSTSSVRFLNDVTSECYRKVPRMKSECTSGNGLDMSFFKNVRVISSPAAANKSELRNVYKFCQNNTCLNITAHICPNDTSTINCTKTKELLPAVSGGTCNNLIENVIYYFYHNGTDGIKEVKAYFWLKNYTMGNNLQFLQRIRVQFKWADSPEIVFERSGNPGYITGKPIMAGKKIYSSQGDNMATKKEAIELTYDPKGWLTTFGFSRERCSSSRMPILFRENGFHTCFLSLTKDDFEKGKCLELQKILFDLLIGEDFSNISSNNFFNKFVATYGNSKVEETGDWAQVLIDLFPIISSQVSYKAMADSVICKNVITGLSIDVAYANIGSFADPQAKILGVSFQFDKPEDLVFQCEQNSCKNSNVSRIFSVSTAVNFMDLTEPAVQEFAEPPGLEAKLPHDFFYPFFSNGSKYSFSGTLLICTLLVLVFF